MALVFAHNEPQVPLGTLDSQVLIGNFFGNGQEYLAYFGYDKVDFYLLKDYWLKYKSIEVQGYRKPFDDGSKELLAPFKTSNGFDSFLIELNPRGSLRLVLFYWNGEDLVPFWGNTAVLLDNPLAPGMALDRLNNVYKDGNILDFAASTVDYNFFRLLDSDTALLGNIYDSIICEIFVKLISTNQVISLWRNYKGTFFSKNVEEFACYLNAHDRSKIMVCSDSFIIIDISQSEAVVINDLYSFSYGLEETNYKFSHYDKRTGDAVFVASGSDQVSFYTFKEKELTVLEVSGKAFQQSYVFKWPVVYEVVINSNHDLELVYINCFPLPKKVEHTCRDLAGTSYIDQAGIFRESLVFRAFDVVKIDGIEPVQDIFPIGNDCVLISGASSSAVVRIRTGTKKDTWHKPEATIFASKNFQVTKSKLYTRRGETELPDVLEMFVQSGTRLVAGNSSKIYVISEDLEIEQEIEDSCIYNLFDGGYLTATTVKFFDELKEDIPSNGAVDIAVINGKLYTTSLKLELKELISQQKIDLNLETVEHIYDCGCGTIIVGPNDSFLYTNGEFFSVRHSKTEKMMILNKKTTAVSLLDGVVYMKSNIGYHMVKKSMKGLLDYGKISVYMDKLLFSHPDKPGKQFTLCVRPIRGGVVRSFKPPPQSQIGALYFMVSNEQAIEIADGKIYEIDLNRSTRTYTDIRLDCGSTMVSSPTGDKLYATWCNGLEAQVYRIKNGKFQLLDDHSADESCYKFGSRAIDYPKSGDHWLSVLYSRPDERVWEIANLKIYFHLTPKTEPAVVLANCVGTPIGNSCAATFNAYESAESLVNEVACVQSKNEPQTYYVAHGLDYGACIEVTKLHPDKPQELYATVNAKSETVRYTNTHGPKVKYEPDFIAAGCDTLTITLLPPEEAQRLKAVQKELALKWCQQEEFEIDGKLLLTFLNDPVNDKDFIKHGIDPNQLKKDLLDVFK